MPSFWAFVKIFDALQKAGKLCNECIIRHDKGGLCLGPR